MKLVYHETVTMPRRGRSRGIPGSPLLFSGGVGASFYYGGVGCRGGCPRGWGVASEASAYPQISTPRGGPHIVRTFRHTFSHCPYIPTLVPWYIRTSPGELPHSTVGTPRGMGMGNGFEGLKAGRSWEESTLTPSSSSVRNIRSPVCPGHSPIVTIP